MYRKIVSLLCITLLLSSCSGKKQEQKEDDFVSMDLPQLKAGAKSQLSHSTVPRLISSIKWNRWVTNTT